MGTLSSAEIFDPVAGTLRPSGTCMHGGGVSLRRPFPMEAYFSPAAVTRNRERPQRSFDPTTKKFRATASMIFPRSEHSAVSLPGGLVLITGARRAGRQSWRMPRFSIHARSSFFGQGRWQRRGTNMHPACCRTAMSSSSAGQAVRSPRRRWQASNAMTPLQEGFCRCSRCVIPMPNSRAPWQRSPGISI